jgi:hypothetical protein
VAIQATMSDDQAGEEPVDQTDGTLPDDTIVPRGWTNLDWSMLLSFRLELGWQRRRLYCDGWAQTFRLTHHPNVVCREHYDMLYEDFTPYFFKVNDPGNTSGLMDKLIVWHHLVWPPIEVRRLSTPSANPNRLLPHLFQDGYYRVGELHEDTKRPPEIPVRKRRAGETWRQLKDDP